MRFNNRIERMQNRRIKVLHVVEATAAGVGRHVSDLASTTNLDLFDLSIAWSPIRSDERFRQTIEQLQVRGIQTYAIPMSRGIEPLVDFVALAKLVRLIAREQFDVVHTHSSKAGFLGRLAARMAKPSAITVYSPNAISISLNRAYWYPEKAAAWLTDALIAVSDSERKELSGYKLVPTKKLVRITAGIPLTEEVQPLTSSFRDNLRIPTDAVVIGTVGRVSYQKDPDTFLAAAERILRANPEVYFVWIGPGEDLEKMREETIKRGLADRVMFTGYRKDAQHLLQAADIFVLASRYESFGYVTCEAMALSKPVVASRVAGSSELVDDGVTGFLVPPGDALAFADALQQLLHNKAMRNRFGAAGRKRVEQHFSLKRMVEETQQLYLDLLSAKQSGARQEHSFSHSVEAK